jgi:CRP-like cAMP-binding protein
MSSGDPSRSNGTGRYESSLLLDLVRQSHERVILPAGAFAFQEGEPCRGAYFVEEGELQLVISSGSKRIPVAKAKAGHLLAISSVVANCDYQCSAIAARDSKVVFIPPEVVLNYLREHPESCLLAVQMMGAELLDLSSNIIRPMKLQPRYPKQT